MINRWRKFTFLEKLVVFLKTNDDILAVFIMNHNMTSVEFDYIIKKQFEEYMYLPITNKDFVLIYSKKSYWGWMFKKDIYKMEIATYEEYVELFDRLDKIVDINYNNVLNEDFKLKD
jgi:hypothetical protein